MIAIFKQDEKNLLLNLDVSEADLTNADGIKAELIQLFETHQKHVILNMSKVEYTDSTFLGALVAVLRQMIPAKKDIILVGLSKDLANMFALVRLDKVFKLYSNFDEAIAG